MKGSFGIELAIAVWVVLPLNSVQAQTPDALTPTSQPIVQSQTLGQPNVFPVGLNVNRRTVFPSILVRGLEDGSQAINFANWLLPYDAVIAALKSWYVSTTGAGVERSPDC